MKSKMKLGFESFVLQWLLSILAMQKKSRAKKKKKKKKSTDNSADSRRRDTAEQNGLIKLTQWRALKWSAGERRNSANNKKGGGA